MEQSFEEVRRTVLALDRDFMKHAAARDAGALVNGFYADDARVLPPGMPAVEGKAAIAGLFQMLFEGGLRDLALDTHFVDVSGELAYAVGEYSMIPPGGSQLDRGKYVVVYRRQQDGAWKAVADMFSSNLH